MESLPPASDDPAVLVEGLVCRYGDLVAVNGLDLSVPRGACLALLGPNGAGKTTTVETLEGLRRPDGGRVRILGLDPARHGGAIRERIGVQLQETRLQDKLTVFETLRLFRSFYRRGFPPDEVIARVGLRDKRDTRVQHLSGGQRQRLTLGCALVNDPDLLFLDEPTTGLDPHARRAVWALVEDLRARGRTILLTTHFMEEAERLADHVVIIDRGRVIARGAPSEIVERHLAPATVEARLPRGVDPAALRQLPGVERVSRIGGIVRLATRDPHATLLGLVERSREGGFRLEELRTHRTTLEDVFLELTGRSLVEDESDATAA